MTLSSKEEQLVNGFRKLPAEAAEQVSALIDRLAALSPTSRIDWSDEWSEEDLRSYTAASTDRVEADEREQHH